MITEIKGSDLPLEANMKYIVCYSAKRKNAKRHVVTEFGRRKFFNSIEEAKQNYMFNNDRYNAWVMTSKFVEV